MRRSQTLITKRGGAKTDFFTDIDGRLRSHYMYHTVLKKNGGDRATNHDGWRQACAGSFC